MALIECSECGAKISDKSDKCVKCGCPIEKRQPSSNVIALRPVFCTHCGKENKGDKPTCAYCGKEIGESPIDYCRHCGAETGIFTDQEVCKKCGRNLSGIDEKEVESLIVHERSGCLPVIGSLLIPGLGHLMRGEILSGIVFFLFSLALGSFTWGVGYFIMSLLSAIALTFSPVPKCPKCKGVVSEDAVKCKHCQSDLVIDG